MGKWNVVGLLMLLAVAPNAARADAALEANWGGEAIPAADLGQTSGGGLSMISNSAQATAVVSGNTIGNVGSTGAIGANNIVGNSGITNVLMNSGNQVNLSVAEVVTVILHP